VAPDAPLAGDRDGGCVCRGRPAGHAGRGHPSGNEGRARLSTNERRGHPGRNEGHGHPTMRGNCGPPLRCGRRRHPAVGAQRRHAAGPGGRAPRSNCAGRGRFAAGVGPGLSSRLAGRAHPSNGWGRASSCPHPGGGRRLAAPIPGGRQGPRPGRGRCVGHQRGRGAPLAKVPLCRLSRGGAICRAAGPRHCRAPGRGAGRGRGRRTSSQVCDDRSSPGLDHAANRAGPHVAPVLALPPTGLIRAVHPPGTHWQPGLTALAVGPLKVCATGRQREP
jgi:hypothetical protein